MDQNKAASSNTVMSPNEQLSRFFADLFVHLVDFFSIMRNAFKNFGA